MARRSFSLGRLLGQIVGWLCLIAGALEAITRHP